MTVKKGAFRGLLISALVWLAGAAAAEEEDDFDLSAYEDAGDACINPDRIRDYTVIDRRNLIIEVTGRDKYLMVLRNSCFGLYSSHALGFPTRTTRICGGFGDRILLGRGESCLISEIIPVESSDIARKIVEARKAED